MSIKHLSEILAKELNITKKEAFEHVKRVFDAIEKEFVKEGKKKLNIKGFGTFEIKQMPAREYKIPGKKDKVKKPERLSLRFRPSDTFIKKLNGDENV